MMGRRNHWTLLCLLSVLASTYAQSQDIVLIGKHVCSRFVDNQLKFEINFYDNNTIVTGIKALDANDAEIETCTYTGAGTQTSPFRVVSYVNLTSDTETNGCGLRMSTVNNEVFYSWHLRGFRAVDASNTQRRGFILNATCSKTNITDGNVQTLVSFNISSLTVSARFPENVTGINTFATNSDLTATLVVYPNGQNVPQVLQNAQGLSLRNCFSGTDASVQQNRQLFVNASGCPLTGTNVELTNPPQARAGSGTSPIIVDASYFRARNVSGSNTVYIQCSIFKCTVPNDPHCNNSCAAISQGLGTPSAVDTGLVFTTSFTVQDQLVQQLLASTVADPNTFITSVVAGTPIRITSKHAPNGVALPNINALIRSAVGFYVYKCRYLDLNSATATEVDFIDDNGCPVTTSTALPTTTGFQFVSLVNGVYTVQSGPITPTVPSYQRLRVRCDTGICTAAGHNFCTTQRCNATNNNVNGAQKLGYQGLEFLLSVYNTTTQPTVSIDIVNTDGQTVNQQDTVVLNEALDFSVTLTPNTEQFPGATGFYIYNAAVSPNANPTNEQKSFFIDENGCRIADSPYATSQNCLMDNTIPGAPPFTQTCGTFTANEIGTLYQSFEVGVCYEVNDPKCLDPCAHGPLVAGDTAVATGSSFQRQIQVIPRDDRRTAVPKGPLVAGDTAVATGSSFQRQIQVIPRDDRRTAVRSQKILITIIAITVVGPIVVLCLVAVVTYFIVNS